MREELKEIGFKEIPHFTIGNSLVYNLGRNRQISISSLQTPNEMVFIGELDENDKRIITNLIVLKNYDYDGLTSLENIKNIISSITGRIFN